MNKCTIKDGWGETLNANNFKKESLNQRKKTKKQLKNLKRIKKKGMNQKRKSQIQNKVKECGISRPKLMKQKIEIS